MKGTMAGADEAVEKLESSHAVVAAVENSLACPQKLEWLQWDLLYAQGSHVGTETSPKHTISLNSQKVAATRTPTPCPWLGESLDAPQWNAAPQKGVSATQAKAASHKRPQVGRSCSHDGQSRQGPGDRGRGVVRHRGGKRGCWWVWHLLGR